MGKYTDIHGLPKVTMSWSGRPTTMLPCGGILLRDAENLHNGKYYLHGRWPTCPDTGRKLEEYKPNN